MCYFRPSGAKPLDRTPSQAAHEAARARAAASAGAAPSVRAARAGASAAFAMPDTAGPPPPPARASSFDPLLTFEAIHPARAPSAPVHGQQRQQQQQQQHRFIWDSVLCRELEKRAAPMRVGTQSWEKSELASVAGQNYHLCKAGAYTDSHGRLHDLRIPRSFSNRTIVVPPNGQGTPPATPLSSATRLCVVRMDTASAARARVRARRASHRSRMPQLRKTVPYGRRLPQRRPCSGGRSLSAHAPIVLAAVQDALPGTVQT